MVSVNHEDTIAALATPPGRGGIAVVRVSGPKVGDIISVILGKTLKAREASLLSFKDQHGNVIDEGIAIYFSNPHSFTGEDVLELHGHGGPVVVDLLLQTLLELGVRMARPGEFSERAFLNNKLDLAQAEAIADLINASSRQAAQSAMRSLQGDFSKAVHALNEKIIYLRTYIEAAIDFSDEEIDFLADDKVAETARQILLDLEAIRRNAKQGSFLREGIRVVIVGEPNVGKSSLLNTLSGKELAIVTDIPGTTRDVLRDEILIDGMPLHIIDTAGLRESDDVVEQEGIRRAYQEIASSDLVLFLTDHQRPFIYDERFKGKPVVYVKNKADLYGVKSGQKTNEIQSSQKLFVFCPDLTPNHPVICLSAKTGQGVDELKNEIKKQVGFQGESDGVFLARRRHLDALARASRHVETSLIQLSEHQSGELAAEDLRQAHLALCEITGEFSSDDLLGKIFSSFCIGK